MKSLFSQQIWHMVVAIPPGRVTTYGNLARAAGGGGQASRSVSGILGKFPNQNIIPWHRIVYAGGKVWCSEASSAKRMKLYKREGIQVNDKGIITNFEDVLLDFSELKALL